MLCLSVAERLIGLLLLLGERFRIPMVGIEGSIYLVWTGFDLDVL